MGLNFDFEAALRPFPFLILFHCEAYASLTKRVQGFHITQGSVTYSAHREKRLILGVKTCETNE